MKNIYISVKPKEKYKTYRNGYYFYMFPKNNIIIERDYDFLGLGISLESVIKNITEKQKQDTLKKVKIFFDEHKKHKSVVIEWKYER